MLVETLERNYGHHHPTYMQEAARAIGYGHGGAFRWPSEIRRGQNQEKSFDLNGGSGRPAGPESGLPRFRCSLVCQE